jgi:hypothetical protein
MALFALHVLKARRLFSTLTRDAAMRGGCVTCEEWIALILKAILTVAIVGTALYAMRLLRT